MGWVFKQCTIILAIW